MQLIKPPIPDASLDAFDGGVGVLTRNGDVAGHVVTTRGSFWSPFSPRRRQWWIWYLVVWADGTRERSEEDYPPFIAVEEMKSGYLEVLAADADRAGRYDFRWLPRDEGAALLEQFGITHDDF